uniref:ATP synthase F0 subunit 8 n=1 Tax=Urostylis flavoannulata TaxID=2164054 RepID=A0A343W959_9HEMI|nr:ATP synthase F0 subunit 8 [Urostylis flavoannulata]AVZ00899.1 ATP synthase F0 subunit 8 [Urostylis flavoannulata]
MPQMMPLWWETLMTFFIITMLMFSIIIYHNKSFSNKIKKYQKDNNQHNWMW